MGGCGCSAKYKFYRLGNEIMLVETHPYCENCGKGIIQIGLIKKEEYDIFQELLQDKKAIKKFPIWGETQLQINAIDFKEGILKTLEESIDEYFENLPEKEFDLVYKNKIIDKIGLKLPKIFKRQLKEF